MLSNPPPIKGKSTPKTKEDIFEHGHAILDALKSHHLNDREEEGNLFKRVAETYGEKNAHKLINGAARAANERPGYYGIPEVHGEDRLTKPAQTSDPLKTGFFSGKSKSRITGGELPPPPPIRR